MLYFILRLTYSPDDLNLAKINKLLTLASEKSSSNWLNALLL